MFENIKSFKLDNLSAFSDNCSSVLKRIKFVDNSSFIIFENTFTMFIFYHVSLNGEIIKKWEFEVDEDILLDYIYIDNKLYLVFISQFFQYEECINFYCSSNNDFEWIGYIQKECYLHDMDFIYIFNKDDRMRFLMIRHNRIHLYTIENIEKNDIKDINNKEEFDISSQQITELSVLEGYKWIISNGYAVNIKGKNWEIYNTDLELICSFKFTDDMIDWLGVSISNDGSIIAVATDCNEEEKGALAIYNKNTNQLYTHFQRYGFFSMGIVAGEIWGTVFSSLSNIGGLMIFNKKAQLKYTLLRDEEENNIRAYNPAPIVYQALSIISLLDNKVLLVTDNNIFITDVTCKNIQNLPYVPYDCINLSSDKSKLIIVSYENRLYGGNPDQKYSAEILIYNWSSKQLPASIVDLKSYMKE